MINLIKAEWHRLIHTGVLKYFIFVCLMFPVIIIMTDINFYKMTVSENMFLFSQNSAIMVSAFLSVAISIPISLAYQNKTAYYEIMCGTKTHKILLSKAVIYTAIFIIGITFTFGVYFGILGIINGIGDMSEIPLRFILFMIVIIRICVASVFISMLMKHIVSIILVMLRFMMFDSLLLIILTPVSSYSDSDLDVSVIGSQGVSDWLISGQMTKIFSADIDGKLVLMIIITAAFEIAIWYILTYISYKKKIFQ